MSYKVSIISAIYNSEKYLHQCLESLVSQTLSDIEIILINDASPDNSLEILTEYKNKYPNLITLIDLPENIGGGGALNKGLDIAQGEYISFVDPDDYVDIYMCEKLYKHAKEHNSDIVQFSYLSFVDHAHKGRVQHKTGVSHGISSDLFDDKFMSELNKKKCICMGMDIGPIWSRFYRRSLWSNISYQAKNIYFDVPTILFPILLANTFSKLDTVLYRYRLRDGSVSTMVYDLRYLPHMLSGFEFLISQAVDLNLFCKYKHELTVYIFRFLNYIIFGKYFHDRHFYRFYKSKYKFHRFIVNHLKEIETLFPEYLDKLLASNNKRNQRKLKFLLAYPRVLKAWLDLKFGLKNLWHFCFW